jgi:hypothetical protein
MKFLLQQKSQAGNTLLMVLMCGGILVAALGTYLGLTSSENKNVKRSICWNAALPVAEAGIEEAMSHVVANATNFSADGWTTLGTNNVYTKNRTNGADYYSVNVAGSPGSTLLTITSTGYVHWLDSAYISRAVQVTVQNNNAPPSVGLVANSITFGGNTSIDSYDTSNPAYCNTNNFLIGFYDSSRFQANAFVGTPGLTLSIGGSTHIYGYTAAGVGGSVNRSGAAIVGDLAWNSKSIEPGYATNGYAINMPQVIAPFTSGSAPGTNTVGGTNYTYYLNGGKYFATDLTAGGVNASMYVAQSSSLYVASNINLSKIVFAYNGTNSPRLDLYLAQDAIICPQIVGAAPTQFHIWGLDTCTSLDMTGGNNFVGVIYARKANVSVGGHSAFFGSLMCNSFSSQGTFDYHFDTATLTSPTNSTAISSWAEL